MLTSVATAIAASVVEVLHKFHDGDYIPGDICDYLEGKAPEEVLGLKDCCLWTDFCLPELISAELEFGNERLVKLLTDSINGEDGVPVSREILAGIVRSHNAGLHELLGKLLCAARLQEGLRQAICESMDEGCVEAFVTLLNVIRENGFIRYSSVKRAVGCWLGFMTEDASKLERVSGKSIDYIYECLTDPKKRDEYLATDDAMKIHIALWSLGFFELRDVVAKIKEFAEKGMRRQLLVASYSTHLLSDVRLENEVAKVVVERYSDDAELMAGYLAALYSRPCLADKNEEEVRLATRSLNKKKRERYALAPFFEDAAEGEKYYAILKEIYGKIKGKVQSYSPFIFPWHSAELSKFEVIEKMAYLANALKSEEKADEVCLMLDACASSGGWSDRSGLLYVLTKDPETETQLRTLVSALGDKSEYVRSSAYDLIRASKEKLTAESYLQFEDMLRMKGSDVRSKAIKLLMGQSDDALYASAERLLGDRKSEKRLAGLDIVLNLSKDEKKKTLYERCRALAEKVTPKTSAEQIVLDTVLHGAKSQATETNTLYTDADVFRPEVPDAKQTRECVETFMKYFPDSGLREAIKAGEADEEFFKGANKEGNKEKKDTKEEKGKKGKKAKKTSESENAQTESEKGIPLAGRFEDLDDESRAKAAASMMEMFDSLGISDPSLTEILNSKVNAAASCDSEKKGAKDSSEKKQIVGCKTSDEADNDLKALCAFIESHEKDEFQDAWGEKQVVGDATYRFKVLKDDCENREYTVPFRDLWKDWIDKRLSDPGRVLRAYLKSVLDHDVKPSNVAQTAIDEVYGVGFSEGPSHKYLFHARAILDDFLPEYLSKRDLSLISIAILLYFLKRVPNKCLRVSYKSKYGSTNVAFLMEDRRISEVVHLSDLDDAESMTLAWPILVALDNKYREARKGTDNKDDHSSRDDFPTQAWLKPQFILLAHYRKLITLSQAYRFLFYEDQLKETFSYLTKAICFIRENDKLAFCGRFGYRTDHNFVNKVKELFSDEGFAKLVCQAYDAVTNEFLSVELKRGDSETKYSKHVREVERIYGVEIFVAILAGLGKETIDRSSYFYYTDKVTKKKSFSWLLNVCVPAEGDDVAKLRSLLKDTDITTQRLVEAALFNPAWLDLIGQYLNWEGFASGCYYFIAHMNEDTSDKQKAIIAKYTPLSEDELRGGAFDSNWFRSAYATLGAERFGVIYDAAKYITDGTKHTRARQYADAVLGKFTVDDTEKTITEKRNKTLVMAYALIPLTGEDDICRRYLFLQNFLKESKQFGAQRIASEKEAVAMALRNLATNAGYSDVTRLTLRMETKLIDNCRDLFNDVEIDDVSVRLEVDDFGATDLVVTKNGKALKSVPTKIKKNDYIVRLREMKKSLTEQYSRTRQMFEEAMEDQTLFSIEELEALRANPVVEPIIRHLVFMTEKGKLGFLLDGSLVDHAGKKQKLTAKTQVTVAHPFHLYKDGHWVDYQRALFDQGIVQPFKQVFRELYVKTAEELDTNESLRYSGNQILPQRTVGCLKKRRWVADYYDGLQKVFYKENIIATIYALCDWFTPADIEAPTLEWVAFYDRQTGARKLIRDVPDVIFSEVMRDVDLAVSVAHAGGVDPETSHSTIEMRAALAEFTLPLFKLTNVTIEKSHAHIVGKYGHYTVHLGSGVVHKLGGTMINILPVHSQHRGKLFLPFADDDPKTAEILTKILFLAEDSKIQDPSILEQIV